MIRLIALLAVAATCVGCGGEQEKESRAVDQKEISVVSFNADHAPVVEFNVPDMMCPEGCGEKTKEILSQQAGAKEVMIDFDGKRAIVAVEPGRFDEKAALSAMVDHGFDHTTLKSDVMIVKAPSGETPAVQ